MARGKLGVLYAIWCFQGVSSTPTFEQKPIVGDLEVGKTVDGTGESGRIVLYPGSRIFPDDLDTLNIQSEACADAGPSKAIELAPGVCLSGEYYARDNLRVDKTPKCADGSVPKLSFYRNRKCTGVPQLSAEKAQLDTNRCLWSKEDVPVPSYYWSMIFRCDAALEGSELHETATPPSLKAEFVGPLPGRMRYHGGAPFQCHTDFANNRQLSAYMPDGCDWIINSWPHEAIEILAPAICPNGTRAQLALYEDFTGNWRHFRCFENRKMPNFGLLDIDDSTLQTCINVKHMSHPMRSIGAQFYCDGLEYKGDKPVLPKVQPEHPLAGVVSHSVCSTSSGTYQWKKPEGPPTYLYPSAGTCVNLPKAHQVKPFKNAVCPDGSQARFATWAQAGCNGWPMSLEGVDSSMFLNCYNWNLREESSYMFWCDSQEKTIEGNNKDDHRAVITRNGCPKEPSEKNWVRVKDAVGPTIERIDPDKCIGLSERSKWKVFKGASCADGSAARVALWKTRSCRGNPASITDLESSPLDKCLPICTSGSCSVSFWCEGIGR